MANDTMRTPDTAEENYSIPSPQAEPSTPQNFFGTGVIPNSATPSSSFLPQEPLMMAGNPQTAEEAYLGSFLAVLQDNLGYYVVIEFLIGTSGLTEKEGILYSAGNNFVTLYEQETNRYIVCDLYSIKFVTFYNQTSRPRSRMLSNNGRNSMMNGRRNY